MFINNFNARLSISNYEAGQVYSFYINNTTKHHLVKVAAQDIKGDVRNLAKKLIATIDANPTFMSGDGQYWGFTYATGIIVDKHEALTPNDINQLTVMFKTVAGKYVLNTYAVGVPEFSSIEQTDVYLAAAIRFSAA